MALEEVLVENIVFLPPGRLSNLGQKIACEAVFSDKILKTPKGETLIQYWQREKTFAWCVDIEKVIAGINRYGQPPKGINILVSYRGKNYVFMGIENLEFFTDSRTGLPSNRVIHTDLILAYHIREIKGTERVKI